MLDMRRKASGSGLLNSLVGDTRGAIAVCVVLIAPVMLGIGALTLDIGRLRIPEFR